VRERERELSQKKRIALYLFIKNSDLKGPSFSKKKTERSHALSKQH
jgi:hypothetical protein